MRIRYKGRQTFLCDPYCPGIWQEKPRLVDRYLPLLFSDVALPLRDPCFGAPCLRTGKP